MADYRSMFDRDYLGSWDLAGRDVTATISRVVAGELTAQGGRKSKKPIIYFEAKEKGLVLNRTNAKTIAGLYGNETQKWVGKKITMYPTTTHMGAEVVDAIRVRNAVPAAKLKPAEVETEAEPGEGFPSEPGPTRDCPTHGTFSGNVCPGCAASEAM